MVSQLIPRGAGDGNGKHRNSKATQANLMVHPKPVQLAVKCSYRELRDCMKSHGALPSALLWMDGEPEAVLIGSRPPRGCVLYVLALPRFLRIESPRISIRCALCTSRSRMPSASVGSPICSCQRETGSWEVRIVERTW